MKPEQVKIAESWRRRLEPEFAKPYFDELTSFVRHQYQTTTVFPPPKLVFNAFDHCLFEDVKVVILGQDPYHNVGQANGLAFSVNAGVKLPPSLQNIYKEIKADIGELKSTDGDLTAWANQGVLLLNATLTVQAHTPGSLQNKGWERFTDAVIEIINREKSGVVFMLWGSYARAKGEIIDRAKHLVLEAPHPSPFSANRGFFGCKHFSQANSYFISRGQEPIIW